MAQRRMFSQKIVSSDAFLDMPTSARELYFQLGMYADDDGFINPKKIIRMVGASEDDLRILVAKRFVLTFENGVIVIKHWLINNLIRKDFYQPTVYEEQKKLLNIKENKAYTECLQNVNNLDTQVRLGKVRLGKDITNKNTSGLQPPDPVNSFIHLFEPINPSINYGHKTNRSAADWLIKKYGLEKAVETAKYAISIHGKEYAPTITTPYQLKENLSKLLAYYKRENNKKSNVIMI